MEDFCRLWGQYNKKVLVYLIQLFKFIVQAFFYYLGFNHVAFLECIVYLRNRNHMMPLEQLDDHLRSI